MQIRFCCQNGHPLKAAARHAGRVTRCPRCHVSVTVPHPPARSHLTDSQAVRLIGSHAPRAQPYPTDSTFIGHLRLTERRCPKCQNLIADEVRICPYCNVYFGT